jgi:hypothetical protein
MAGKKKAPRDPRWPSTMRDMIVSTTGSLLERKHRRKQSQGPHAIKHTRLLLDHIIILADIS